MKLSSLATAVTGLVIFATAALAQITTLEGNVIGADGKPVVGAVIKIHRTDVKWDATTKTDKRGHYIHTGVPLGGVFDMTCTVEGKDVDQIHGVHSQMSDHPGTDFDLRKLASSNNAATQAAVQKALETGQISDDLKRQMSPEQKAALQKQIDEQSGKIKKQKQLNDSFNEGVVAVQNKQWEPAIASLLKAEEVDPNQPAVYANLGDAYTGLAGTKTGEAFDDNMTKALAAYAKAIELAPEEAGTHNNYGLALAKNKKYPEAEAELRKAAELDPPSAFQRFYNLGALLSNNNQSEPASKAFKAAIDAAPDNPKNAEAYFQFGMSQVAQCTEKDGKYICPPGTVETLQKYLTLAPTGPNVATAQATIQAVGGTIDTTYKNPKAPVTKKK